MGRDASFYCRTCRIEYRLGYGSYGTWLDGCDTLEQFDKAVAKDPRLADLLKNRNVRKCLEEHHGHHYEAHSTDWTYEQGGVLYSETGPMGAGEPLIEDYDAWKFVDLAPDR